MRLFIAAKLPQNMMEALAETQALLRECVQGRFTAPGNLHVTLAFLGEVSAARVEDVTAALERGCAHHAAFSTRLGEFGSFGPRKNATLWQGFSKDEAFVDLAKSVRAELDCRCISYDEKPMRAHVTLMRHVDLSAGVLPMPLCEPGIVEHTALFASTLTPDGPIYEPLHICELR